MSDTLNINFVDGTFQEEDARDILLYLIQKKINFHNTRLFDLDERFARECEFSKDRLRSLKQSKEELKEVLKLASVMGKNIRVKSEIVVELVDAEPTVRDGKLMHSAN